uniref:Uncharacterized protein n=1 Tax=Parastrongyloides trichosuri TaxID=131310 RepID=A0A0N4ZUM8_PARTI
MKLFLITIFLFYLIFLSKGTNICEFYQDFYYKPNKCDYKVSKTNFSTINCLESYCLYASGRIQVSNYNIFEGKFYGCPSYLQYITTVLGIDDDLISAALNKCKNINSCMELDYKLPTIPLKTIIDMTICCHNVQIVTLYDPPEVIKPEIVKEPLIVHQLNDKIHINYSTKHTNNFYMFLISILLFHI